MELDDIYNQRIFDIAAATGPQRRLEAPDASATAVSKLCGSTITVDLKVERGPEGLSIVDFGQVVRACLLGQASASIVQREIVGTGAAEIRDVAAVMRRMLKEGGSPPGGRWADLALLQPVRDYPHRQASTLLVFDAIERALAEIEAKDQDRARR